MKKRNMKTLKLVPSVTVVEGDGRPDNICSCGYPKIQCGQTGPWCNKVYSKPTEKTIQVTCDL